MSMNTSHPQTVTDPRTEALNTVLHERTVKNYVPQETKALKNFSLVFSLFIFLNIPSSPFKSLQFV